MRRFANARTRDIESFNQYSDWIFHNPHSRDDEMAWLEQQGPWCPALLDYLSQTPSVVRRAHLLYLPLRADGARAAGRSRAQHPRTDGTQRTGDPPRHLQRDVREAAAIAYNTAREKAFLKSTFEFNAVAEETIGCGVDLLDGRPAPQPRTAPKGFPDDPFLLYGGRIDAGKGCGELVDFFASYTEKAGRHGSR